MAGPFKTHPGEEDRDPWRRQLEQQLAAVRATTGDAHRIRRIPVAHDVDAATGEEFNGLVQVVDVYATGP